jgi:hypothetical protein
MRQDNQQRQGNQPSNRGLRTEVATGQASPKRPLRFWKRRIKQGNRLGQQIAPELYDGSLPTVQDQYQGQNQSYMDLLDQRMREGMSQGEKNVIEDAGTAQIARNTSGALRTSAQALSRGGTGMAGGIGNAMQLDLARGIGDQSRALTSDINQQNLQYKTDATGQYGGALDAARSAALTVSDKNAMLSRADLAARIGATGTGVGLLEQTRQEGREDKRRQEDMDLQKELQSMMMNAYKGYMGGA